MNLLFTPRGWDDYLFWQATDRSTLKRINKLLDAVLRDPYAGIGKPEPLKYGIEGAWSRRITEEHRLVYLVTETSVVVLQAHYHSSKYASRRAVQYHNAIDPSLAVGVDENMEHVGNAHFPIVAGRVSASWGSSSSTHTAHTNTAWVSWSHGLWCRRTGSPSTGLCTFAQCNNATMAP